MAGDVVVVAARAAVVVVRRTTVVVTAGDVVVEGATWVVEVSGVMVVVLGAAVDEVVTSGRSTAASDSLSGSRVAARVMPAPARSAIASASATIRPETAEGRSTTSDSGCHAMI